MVFITEQLIRKKSEHNELIIGTLEELSLHQEDIERIEHIHDWCRDLKILLMQNNLIAKLENLNKLKKLEYLNVALNNIERIENLDALESLNKLDLTLNFIGELTSVCHLKHNYNLKELTLTGNPCCEYVGYREYVIACLPQLNVLDGPEIKRAERIVASKRLDVNKSTIVQAQAEYAMKRDEQKKRVSERLNQIEEENVGLTPDEINDKFWKTTSEHCPEVRREIALQQRKNQPQSDSKPKIKRERTLFAECGRPYNINEAKLEFILKDEETFYSLDLAIYRYLDTSLIDVDVQINYVRVTVKGNIFQMSFNDEVNLHKSTSQRSQMTGHLLIVMPKLKANDQGEIVLQRTDVKLNGDICSKPTPGALNEFVPNGAVNCRNIVNPCSPIDESEIPDLC